MEEKSNYNPGEPPPPPTRVEWDEHGSTEPNEDDSSQTLAIVLFSFFVGIPFFLLWLWGIMWLIERIF